MTVEDSYVEKVLKLKENLKFCNHTYLCFKMFELQILWIIDVHKWILLVLVIFIVVLFQMSAHMFSKHLAAFSSSPVRSFSHQLWLGEH